eukprot:1211037-Ditylum_brightwellii.AAC.1
MQPPPVPSFVGPPSTQYPYFPTQNQSTPKTPLLSLVGFSCYVTHPNLAHPQMMQPTIPLPHFPYAYLPFLQPIPQLGRRISGRDPI